MAAEFAGQLAMALKKHARGPFWPSCFSALYRHCGSCGCLCRHHQPGRWRTEFYPAESAFTGEISCAMLRDAGANWLLAGHSERRQACLWRNRRADCPKDSVRPGTGASRSCSALAKQRGTQQQPAHWVLQRQLLPPSSLWQTGSFPKAPDQIAVAYEPVWAIGTSKVSRARMKSGKPMPQPARF